MNFHRTLLALVASIAIAGNGSAVTALIDFGVGTQFAGAPYNQVTYPSSGSGVTTGAVALDDTSATATGWTVSVTETGSGNGGNAGAGANVPSFPPALSAFSASALQDSLFANQGGGTNPEMVVVIAGLDSGLAYDLLFYGSRNNAQGVDQIWSLTQGTGGADVAHFSELNDTVAVDWPGISPNGSGVIEITLGTGADSIGALALNFGSITQVPEPSGTALLGLAILGLLARRRR